MFYFDKILDYEVLKSDYLSNVNHFFTTREFILKSKEDSNILSSFRNRENVQKLFNLDKIITPSQRHTSNIKLASLDNDDYEETDALILTDRKIGIFLNFADCTPVIFYDVENKIGAIAHAGWRGTADKIAQKTAIKLINEFNSKRDNIVALIGPSICFDCFETSEEVANKVSNTVLNSDKYKCAKNGKCYADLKGINKAQLNEIGIEKVDIAPYCTCCDNDKFFSYRKENKTTNRMSAFICLN